MQKYVTKALHKFQHPTPNRIQYAPHKWTRPNYGATKQLATPLDTSQPIPEEQKHRIQNIIGTFLYYSCVVDCNMLPALNTLSEQQSNPTKNTEATITQFLDYSSTNPSAIIQYKSSDMILHIDSNASYLSDPWLHSRTGGPYYLRSLPTYPKKYPNLPPPANGPIHMEYRIPKHVVACADKAEVRGMIHNGQTAILLHITLHELGFTRPPTPIKIDNSAAEGIVTSTVIQKSSKAMDMRFY